MASLFSALFKATLMTIGVFIIFRILTGQWVRFSLGKLSLFSLIADYLQFSSSYTPPREEKPQYLETSSALAMGMTPEEIHSYNTGNPQTRMKFKDKEPYIQKTKYY